MRQTQSLNRRALLVGSVAVALLAIPLAADDVDLIRSGQQDPYVFLLLDVSGSMNWSVPCTAEDITNNLCKALCPTGECTPRLVADDPDNRLFVAKEAIFGLMEETTGVNFGFGTFDQDQVRVEYKQWWYAIDATLNPLFTGVTLDSGRRILVPGEQHIFGQTYTCPTTGGTVGTRTGCTAADAANLGNPWSEERVRRWPKADDDNDTTNTYFVIDPADNRRYRITFSPATPATQRPGNTLLNVPVRVRRCTNNGCTSFSTIDLLNQTLAFTKQSEFIQWDWDPPADPNNYLQIGFMWDQQHILQSGQNGWEHNNDSGNDAFNGYNLKYTTTNDPQGRGTPYGVGDIVPWDWLDDRRSVIKQRMAPNTLVSPAAQPDFGISQYFNDFRQGTEAFLRLKTTFFNPSVAGGVQAKPLLPSGGTPTGDSMDSFRSWVQSWIPAANNTTTGDIDLLCKTLNLVVLTDGQATDGSTSCTVATSLLNMTVSGTKFKVRSFAVALGDEALANPGFNNVLNCIADNGGSGKLDVWDGDGKPDGPGPIFAKNKEALIKALDAILGVIGGTGKSFAAAAVQRSQANAGEKIVLSSFIPLKDQNVWPGRIDAFLKPVPTKDVTIDGILRKVPNRNVDCGGGGTRSCQLWDAGEQLVALAPDTSDLAADDFKLGISSTERRVFYAPDNPVGLPDNRLFLDKPATDSEWETLTTALGICASGDAPCAAAAASRTQATDVLKFIYKKKTFEDPETLTDVDFVLGEIFHSSPIIVGSPDNFRYFSQNRNGYRDYFEEHRFRRKVLAVNSNDGQLHLFDAGIFQGNPDTGKFDNGTGNELAAVVPHGPMPTLTVMADSTLRPDHYYTVDGSITSADVFIDPSHSGTPTDTDREWRTVLFSGLREGGRTVFAVDVTQPDLIPANRVPTPGAGNWVPSCVTGSTTCGTLPYPSVLWEFRDDVECDFTLGVTDPGNHPGDARCDNDQNKKADLGFTWSNPVVGIIRVCESAPCNFDPTTGNIGERFVAIFAGGMDPEAKGLTDQSGNYLYMIDVETGKAIYKRRLGNGAAASEPSAVDTDQDGFIDTIYVGTTAGAMYKVDIRTAAPILNLGLSGKKVSDVSWTPFEIFNTGGRPIYFPPAVVFVPDRVQFALAFGTGDREDLWEKAANDEGRFYVFIDDDFVRTDFLLPGSAFTQADLRQISLASGDAPAGTNFLLDEPPPGDLAGWYFPLLDEERLITPAFALGGITVFTTFQPRIDKIGNAECAARGDSKVYVVFTTTGDAVSDDRFEVVKSLLSETFVDSGTQGDDGGAGGGGGGGGGGEKGSCVDSDRAKKIVEELMALFPKNCRFTNKTVCLEATEDTTALKILAPVPVCVIEKNWKEL